MNWLAHLFLSENSIDYQLGNFLADPLKGKCWEGASRKLIDGMRMHRRIDSFTDNHAAVSLSKSRLGPKGYLKGVIIDIVYDHLLIKNWSLYSHKSFEQFIARFYQQASFAITSYPENVQKIVTDLIRYKTLSSYKSLDGVGKAFAKIDKRLSKRLLETESATSYFFKVEKEIAGIERDYLEFFPDLINFFLMNQHGLTQKPEPQRILVNHHFGTRTVSNDLG